MINKSNDAFQQQEIAAFKQHCIKLWCVSDLAASSDLFDHFIHPQGFVFWNKEQVRQLWDFWSSAQSYKPMEEYPIYSVVGLDQEVEEPHLIIGEDYLMVSELFHTNDGQAALEKLEQFKIAFPVAMITNNAIIALEYTTIKKERLEKELGLSGRSC